MYQLHGCVLENDHARDKHGRLFEDIWLFDNNFGDCPRIGNV